MSQIDLKDKKIIAQLDLDARQSNKQIAKKVKLSEQVVGQRIKRLQEKKIIESFFVRANPSLIGFFHIKAFLRFQNLTKKKELEMFDYLKKQKGFFWLCSTRGKYDLVATIYVRNFSEFSELYEEIFHPWSEYIIDKNILILEKGSIHSRAYLLPKQNPSETEYSRGSEEKIKLDDLDDQLLKILNHQGRKPLVEIAQQLRVSSDTIRYRINSLKKKCIITGFGAKINFSKLGSRFYIVFLKMQNMNLQKSLKLDSFVRMNKNIIYYIKCFGDHDYEIELEVKNTEEFDAVLRSLRDNFVAEIKDYEILEVTQEHVMNFYPF